MSATLLLNAAAVTGASAVFTPPRGHNHRSNHFMTFYIRPDRPGVCLGEPVIDPPGTVILTYPEGGFGYWLVDALTEVAKEQADG